VIEQSNMLMSGSYIVGGKAGQPTEDSMRSAGIMITIIPVLIVYPFVKNFFSKGMVLGAVKE
jgi:putative aldouronate transport system permease protein